MEKRIEYYEFPNKEIVKAVHTDAVYRFDQEKKSWEIDYSLTAVFAWDKPYGDPCLQLRKKVDLSGDLPPFPCEEMFFPGNTVAFGAYPQKSLYDFSPISWIVLETKDSTALCIAKDCLIVSGYCDPQNSYQKPEKLWWENSLARQSLNQDFYDTAFSDEEKARIIPREVSAVQLGKRCTDPVFLLSEQEVLHYFPEEKDRKARPTHYATLHNARSGWTEDTKEYTSWWILPEENAYGYQNGLAFPKAVFQMGMIQFHSRNIYHTDFTLRPCIQIRYKND